MDDNIREIRVRDLKKAIPSLKAGDRIALTGEVYTARDAAHKRMFELLDGGKPLPFEPQGAVIYYTGPTPAREGMPVGSCGPTTSSRMDAFTPRLLDLGLTAMIGKGERSASVQESIIKNGAVYLCAVGGAGALMAKQVTALEEIAFPELGCESVKRLTVEKLPLTVCIDSRGGNIFVEGKAKYAKK
jgi:fumarate hydratase subunit beta